MRQGSGESEEPEDDADGLFSMGDLAAAAAPTEGADGRRFHDGPQARRLLDVEEIHAEPAAADSLRGRQIIARFPEARLIETDSHWRIPHLHGNEGNVERWVRVKRETLVLGERKSFGVRPNGRSADWIAPGLSNGCAMACAYCCVPRRKGFANPITVFTDVERVLSSLGRRIAGLGRKEEPNQCDEQAWVYDIGENGDCSVDDLISDNTADLIGAFRRWPRPRPRSPPSSSTPTCCGSIHRAVPGSGSPSCRPTTPDSSTSGPVLYRTVSLPQRTSSTPGTRCTSTSRRW